LEEPRRLQGRARQAGEALSQEIAELERQAGNLAEAIAKGGRMDVLLDRLHVVNEALDEARRRQRERAEPEEPDTCPTRESIDVSLEISMKSAACTSFEFADFLRRLVPEFAVHPVQALDSGLVRPRARLTIDPSVLCGHGGAIAAGGDHNALHVAIDLFDPPLHIRHMEACLRVKQENPHMSLKEVAGQLAVNPMTVKRACDYAQRMQAAHMGTPYLELRDRPPQASRWLPRNRGSQNSSRNR
jgi:hypothetical protein